MKKLSYLFIFIFVAVWLCGCGTSNEVSQSSENQPRTYYDTLDLDTPEAAVVTFVDAFQRDDFVTVYLVLSPRAQFTLSQRLNLMQYQYLFQHEYREDIFEDVTVFSQGLGQGEHADEMWYVFDQMMLSAKQHSALLIDLSGEVNLVNTVPSETNSGEKAKDVNATVEGIDGIVVFRMVQAPSGRWRVNQVIVEGGNEEVIPWSVPRLGD